MSKDAYHHGNLKQVLTEIAFRAIRECGVQNVSMRDIAKQAGVSSGAAYRHFESFTELLGCVAVLAEDEMSKFTINFTQSKQGSKKLFAVGKAYCDFAATEPHLFALIFGAVGIKLGEEVKLPSGNQNTFQILKQSIAEVQNITPEQVQEKDIAVTWAVAHGAASLVAAGVWLPKDSKIDFALQEIVKFVAAKR